MLRLNAHIVSNRRNWMMRLEEDTVGRHDMIMPACDARRYLDYYGLPDHPNCRDNLAHALSEYGIPYDRVPDPFNFFMHTAILSKGEVEVRESLSEPSDFVVLRALTDLIVAVSSCPNDRSPQNGAQLDRAAGAGLQRLARTARGSAPGTTRSVMDQSQATPSPAEAGRVIFRDQYDIDKLAPEYKSLLDQEQPLPGDCRLLPDEAERN